MSTLPAYRVDGRDVDRDAFYALACDPHRSVVVEACAGAGKTWMLVSRILRALLDGVEPSQILAITFTRKAAGEMRARLNEWLREFATSACSDEQRVRELCARGVDAARARELAPALGRLHGQMLSRGRGVQIRTFHAWFSQLMRMAPLEVLAEMGLQPAMGLIEDVEELRPDLFRRFHRQVAADETLTRAYLALVARHGRSTVGRWLDAAWNRRVEIERADAHQRLDAGIPPAAAVFADCAGLSHPLQLLAHADELSYVAAVARQLGAAGSAKCREAAERLQGACGLIEAGDLPTAYALAFKALHTDKGELRKLPGDWPEAVDLADRLQAIDLRVRQHEAHEDHLHMCALARQLLREFAALKQARARVDMSDLESVALRLLGDATWSGWIQERLDARLSHLLIDEFQDTSPLQWHALLPWLAAYAGAGGGASGQAPLSLFIVGDPKQSIYRFRRAEPRVFEAAADFVAEALGGQRLACDHTRRNAPGVLAALNQVFDQAQREGAFGGFRPHSTEVTDAGDGVFRLPRVARPSATARATRQAAVWRDSLTEPRHTEQEHRGAQEAREVARAIHELLAAGRVLPGQIQVLARRRSVLARLSDALRALHVPHVRPEGLTLADEPEASDLIAVLDWLASPAHDLSLAQALKSPLFGASDDDLLALAAAATGRGWWPALTALARSGEASAALQRAAPLLASWQQAARELPPHDLLDRIVHEGDAVGRMLAAAPPERRAHAKAVIDALLTQSLALDGGRFATPYGVVRALRSRPLKSAAPADAQAVQLLTVHGAKGLEADVVFLMDTDPEARQPEAGTLLVDWPVESDHPTQAAFVARQSRIAPSLLPLHEQEAALAAREELNGLYVAMTRARRRLVLSSVAPHRKAAAAAWWDRIEPLARAWVPGEVGALPAGDRSAFQADDWFAAAAQAAATRARTDGAASVWAAPARSESRISRIGEAFHRLMQWACGPAGPVDSGSAEAWLDAATPEAAAEFELLPAEAGQARRAAAAVLRSVAFARFWRGSGLRWSGDEVPLAWQGSSLRVDRLVCLDDDAGAPVWWVLDYKLDSRPQDQPELCDQLARYRAAVAALQPGEPVRAAFVSGAGDVIELAPGKGGGIA